MRLQGIGSFCCINGERRTIGYVVRQLVEEVHSAIDSRSIISVEFAWVRYITWSGPGFYAGISIEKRGRSSETAERYSNTRWQCLCDTVGVALNFGIIYNSFVNSAVILIPLYIILFGLNKQKYNNMNCDNHSELSMVTEIWACSWPDRGINGRDYCTSIELTGHQLAEM